MENKNILKMPTSRGLTSWLFIQHGQGVDINDLKEHCHSAFAQNCFAKFIERRIQT